MKYAKEFFTDSRVLFISCVLLADLALALARPWAWATVISFFIGLVLFWITEYITHRYLLHEFPKLMPKAWMGHAIHHQRPTETEWLLTPNRYNVAGYILFFLVGLAVWRNFHLTGAMVAGVSVGQMMYEWKHFISHRPIIPLTPWGRLMKKRHLLHHHLDEEVWYGVTNPVLDLVMRTAIDTEHAREVRHHRDETSATEKQENQHSV